MPDKVVAPLPEKVLFLVTTNKAGYSYVIAYHNKWDPEKCRAKRDFKRHVGRLLPDQHVVISPVFARDYPEFADKDWVWDNENKKLVPVEKMPPQPVKRGPEPAVWTELQEATEQSFGASWMAQQMAQKSGMLQDLVEVFGKSKAQQLFNLAIYTLLTRSSAMADYVDWQPGFWAKNPQRLTSQRISELLAEISETDIETYFARRYQHCRKQWQKLPHGLPPQFALDSTSIATYSRSIDNAAYGHAKQNPELKQVNVTLVCDQLSGEIFYSQIDEGSINDVTLLPQVLARMVQADIKLDETLLVTDRGYASIRNVQTMIDTDLLFVQGTRLLEDSLKRAIRKYKESFSDPAFCSSRWEVGARTITETWQQSTDAGYVTKTVYVHLYFDAQLQHRQRFDVMKSVDEVLAAKQRGRKVDSVLWQSYGKYVREVSEGRSTRWCRDDEKLRRDTEFMGYFALRSNTVTDPFTALEIYRRRNMVELNFDALKTDIGGDRLRATESAYRGKLFLFLLATSVRMMMRTAATRNEAKVRLQLPDESVQRALTQLSNLRIKRRPQANSWIVGVVTKKQRDLLTLLDVPLPPKTLSRS